MRTMMEEIFYRFAAAAAGDGLCKYALPRSCVSCLPRHRCTALIPLAGSLSDPSTR